MGWKFKARAHRCAPPMPSRRDPFGYGSEWTCDECGAEMRWCPETWAGGGPYWETAKRGRVLPAVTR
jgi:hypothetical protein